MPGRLRHFTKQNARLYQQKSLESKLLAKACGIKPKCRLRAVKPSNAPALVESPDPYLLKRIVTLRTQLAQLAQLLENETDSLKWHRLSSAQHRIAEEERVLSGRPTPGQAKSGRQRAVEPIALAPVRVAPATSVFTLDPDMPAVLRSEPIVTPTPKSDAADSAIPAKPAEAPVATHPVIPTASQSLVSSQSGSLK